MSNINQKEFAMFESFLIAVVVLLIGASLVTLYLSFHDEREHFKANGTLSCSIPALAYEAFYRITVPLVLIAIAAGLIVWKPLLIILAVITWLDLIRTVIDDVADYSTHGCIKYQPSAWVEYLYKVALTFFLSACVLF
jgi:hypothetical protein